jgi:hypothetical protein
MGIARIQSGSPIVLPWSFERSRPPSSEPLVVGQSSSGRPPLGAGIAWGELARLAVAVGLGTMTRPAARFEVGGGGGAQGGVGLDVVVLGPKALAAVGAGDPIEVGRVADLQGQEHLDRGVAGPAAQVTQVLTVVEDPGEEGIGGDPSGDLGCDGGRPRGSCRSRLL